jgi:hypothetical protein
MAMHVVQFAETDTPAGKTVSADLLADAAALALAAIYIFFIHLSDGLPAIYYEEKCHPHPGVRLSYCVMFLLQNLQANVPQPIAQQAILTEAIRISEQLMREPGENLVEAFSLALAQHLDVVETYINHILDNTHHYPHLTVHILPTGHP